MAVNFTYLDVNPFFGLNTLPDLVRHEEAINSSIGNILGIPRTERWFYPTFGTDIRRFLWEPLDQVTANKIFHDVVMALGKWEPRIQLLSQTAVISNPRFQRFEVNIYYTILQTSVMGRFTAYLRSGGSTKNDLITGPNPSAMVPSGNVLEASGIPLTDQSGDPVFENA